MSDDSESKVVDIRGPRLVTNRPVTNYPPSKKLLLCRAVRATGRTAEAIRIAHSWEAIPRIATEFSGYLTDIVPARDGSEPLLVKCLRNAIDHWYKAAQLRLSENQCFASFLRGLLECLPEVNAWCVHVPAGDEGDDVWDPAAGPLSDWWVKQERPPRLLQHDQYAPRITDADLRLFIATRVLNRVEISRLPEACLFSDDGQEIRIASIYGICHAG